MLPAEVKREQLENRRLLARYKRNGWTVKRGPFCASPFGQPETCAIVSRGRLERLLVMDGGHSFGLFPASIVRK